MQQASLISLVSLSKLILTNQNLHHFISMMYTFLAKNSLLKTMVELFSILIFEHMTKMKNIFCEHIQDNWDYQQKQQLNKMKITDLIARGLSYQQVNEYLTKGESENQNLYQLLTNSQQKHSLAYSENNEVSEDFKYFNNYKMMFSLQQQLKSLNIYDSDGKNLLRETENRIFLQVIKQIKQITVLEEDLKIQKESVEQNSKKLYCLNQNLHDSLCDQAMREKELIIKDSQIEKMKEQEQKINQKHQLVKLICEGIDPMLEEQGKRLKQLQAKKRQFDLQTEKKTNAFKLINELREELEVMTKQVEKTNQKERKLNRINSYNFSEEEVINIIRERLQMEEYMVKEDEQKQQFMKTLQQFKQNFTRVKQENKKLKQSLAEKGIDFSIILSNVQK